MHLVQILLPVFDNHGTAFPAAVFDALTSELTARFGGLTSYVRAPAEGRWTHAESVSYDEIIVLEVMTPVFERDWWKALRARLEDEFRQKEVVVRVMPIERI